MNIEESSQRLNNLVKFWEKQVQRPSFCTIDEDDIEDIKCLLNENKKLKEKFKATSKGLNKVLLKRQKWKDRYYKERLNKRNLIKYLESLLTGKVEIDNFIKTGVLNLLERVRNNKYDR